MNGFIKVMSIGEVKGEIAYATNQKGYKSAFFTLGVTTAYTPKGTTEEKTFTNFYRVVVRAPGVIEFIEKNLQDGSAVWLEGQLKTSVGGTGMNETNIEVGFGDQIQLISGAPPAPKADDHSNLSY